MNLDKSSNNNKLIKKILKAIAYCLVIIFVIIYFLIALINTSAFQSIAAAKLADYFSKEWKTQVRIGAVNINIFDRVAIHDVFLGDRKGDTILLSENILVRLNGFPNANGIKVKSVLLQNTNFNCVIENHKLNFSFIIDYFKSNKPKEKKSKLFIINADQCKFENLNFSLQLKDNKTIYPSYRVAVNNMQFKNVNCDFRNIVVANDSISVKIIDFAAKESSGFDVKKIAGEFIICPKTMIAKDAIIETSNSKLLFDAKMVTTFWGTYSHFIDSVYCEGEIKKGSIAGMKDATYWADVIKGFEQKANINAKFHGKVSELYCERLEISTGKDTYIKGKGSLIGLPNSEKTVYNIDVQELRTSWEDYKSMKLGYMLENLPIPKMVSKLGKVKMVGTFKGLIKEFEGSAKISSEIGEIDLIWSSFPSGEQTSYSAKLNTLNFDVGKLLELPWLSTSGFNAIADVSGNNLDNLEANLIANFKNIKLLDHIYDTISLNGNMLGKEIEAYCSINDEALTMTANTSFVIDEKMKLFVDADISNINPNDLKLFSFSDTTTTFSGKIKADIRDLNPNNLSGNISLRDLRFNLSEKIFFVKRFDAELSNNNSINSLKINSDIIDLLLVGKYNFVDIGKDFAWIIKTYIPNFNFKGLKKEGQIPQENIKFEFPQNNSDFELSATIKNPQPIFDLYSPSIAVSNNSIIYCKLNNREKFSLSVGAKRINIGNLVFENINLESHVNDKDLNTNINCSSFNISDSLYLKNIELNMISNYEKLDFLLLFSDKLNEKSTQGRLKFKSIITRESLQGSFENSEIELLGNRTYINDNHIISYNGEKVAILNLMFYQKNENISINGILSDQDKDKLEISFNNVDLQLFNPLIKNTGLNFKGRLNEKVILKNVLDNLSFTSNLVIDSLELNNNFLGRANINISNTLSVDEYFVDFNILYKGNVGSQNMPLSIKGYIYPENIRNNLNLNVSLKNFNLNIIQNYLSSFSSEVKGLISANNIKVTGPFKQPQINGNLFCKDGVLKIDMINTKYYFSDSIKMVNNKFILKNFKLLDEQKHSLVINGNIEHHNFEDFNINLSANADKIRILNTNASSGQMYYGTAYASAKATIKGDLNFLNIDVAAKTEKGTKLVIPISSKTKVSQNSFIQFVNNHVVQKIDTVIIAKIKPDKKAIEYKINVNLLVNPNAEISLPMNFTSLSGDLTASGEGELKIDIDDKGKFNMYGGIEISNGVFNMSIVNLMDKTFILEKGGKIQWNGSPADGIIDAQAIYKTKASLAPILGLDYSKPVDVQSVIMITGNMMNPKPKFDIRLPNTDAQTVEKLFMSIDRNDEKVMLEQTASLLLMRQFYKSSGEVSDRFKETDLTSSAFELAFGQVAGMLTNMIKFVDIGVNYTPGNEIVTDQIGFKFSKNIGRWVIDGDVAIGGKVQNQPDGASSFIGDINAEYKFTENFRFKVFNKSNANDFTKYNITPYTQGVGITYRKEYESFADVFKAKRKNNILK